MKITREPELFGAGVVAESYDEEPTDRDVEGAIVSRAIPVGRAVLIPRQGSCHAIVFPGITVSGAGPPYIDYCGVDGLRRTSGRLIAIGCRDHCRQSFGMGAGMMAA